MATKTLARDQVRESILDAMDQLLVRFGYQKTTVDDLASEAGIGKGTVYLYFESKEHIALSCIDRLHDRLLVRMSEAAKSSGSAIEKIENVLVERVRTRFDYCRNATTIDEMLSALQKELIARKQQYHADEARVLEELIANAVSTGELPECDAAMVAQSMILATNSFLPLTMRTGLQCSSEELEQRVRRMSRLLVLGVAGVPSTSNIS